MLELNLQFFAAEGPGGEKTEEPTAKKKQDTRKDGKVAKSKELSSGVELIALFLILKFWIGNMGEGFLELFQNIYEKFPQYTTYWGGNIAKRDYSILFRDVYIDILKLLLPFFAVGVAIAFIVNMVQFKFQISTKPLQPKFSKLNPVSGMKRLFSAEKLMELFKSIYAWTGVWQGMGWSSIIYISALSGVDYQLHEAAIVDGANKLQRIVHVDLPSIKPTIVMLLILQRLLLAKLAFGSQNTNNL